MVVLSHPVPDPAAYGIPEESLIETVRPDLDGDIVVGSDLLEL